MESVKAQGATEVCQQGARRLISDLQDSFDPKQVSGESQIQFSSRREPQREALWRRLRPAGVRDSCKFGELPRKN